jgi:sterol desaturase/sphingolipid hydroxylase (fatty acid hydroxylase superfamily)
MYLSGFNIFVVGSILYIPMLHSTLRMPSLSPGTVFKQGLQLYLFLDGWFYITHRMLHWPYLYARIHKVHHMFTAPAAYTVAYAHPLEY